MNESVLNRSLCDTSSSDGLAIYIIKITESPGMTSPKVINRNIANEKT